MRLPVQILLLVWVATFAGCSRDPAKQGKPAVNTEADIALRLPPSTRILLDGNENPETRDNAQDFRYWVYFSKDPMAVPPGTTVGKKGGDFMLSLDLAVAQFKGVEMPKIKEPTMAIFDTWTAKGFNFRGTLVRSPQGDFLLVERHRE